MNSQFNEYVITQLCGYLPVSDLKTVRNLNSIWNMGSKPILEKKGCNHLILNDDSESSLNEESFRKNHFPCQAMRISSTSFSSFQGYISVINREKNQNFSNKYKLLPSVKLLDLRLQIWTELDLQLLNDILEYYSASIQTLILAFDLKENYFLYLRPSLKFPKLLLFCNSKTPYNDHFYQQLFEAAPNIKSIKVATISKGAVDFLLRNQEMLPNLSGLIISFASIDDLYYLTNWPRKLNLLVIYSFEITTWDKVFLFRALNWLLQIQSESLKELYLEKFPCPMTYLQSELTFKFPSCPNLVTLNLDFDGYGFKFEFGENENGINYERDFPKLRNLHISSKYKPWILIPMYDSFFPRDDNQICESLMYLSLSNSIARFVYNLDEGLVKLFPNAIIKYKT